MALSLASFYLCLLVLACISCPISGAHISCEAPCADASDSSFARFPVGGTALDVYVGRADAAYGWRETGRVLRGVLPFSTWTGHVLNLTSQRWLTDKDTSCSVWTHNLVVIVPSNLRFTQEALLLLTEGSNGGPPPTAFNPFILMAAALAVKTHSVTAVLFQVPNQPCTFSDDPDARPRSEDAMIAYTWRHFLDHPEEVEWPARFPMVKASVRAMDTVQAYLRQLRGVQVEKFAVVGASKRGWVAWLTAAVDKRVTCVVPIVMDLLNAEANLAHFYRSLGGWPFTFGDYYGLNVTRDLTSPGMDRLWALVDGYQYRERLTMPKLLVTTSQDEFFLIDDGRFFWDALPEEKHALVLANTEHTLITSIAKVVKAIAAFHLSVMDGQCEQLPGGEGESKAESGGIESLVNSGDGNGVPDQERVGSVLDPGGERKDLDAGSIESLSARGGSESQLGHGADGRTSEERFEESAPKRMGEETSLDTEGCERLSKQGNAERSSSRRGGPDSAVEAHETGNRNSEAESESGRKTRQGGFILEERRQAAESSLVEFTRGNIAPEGGKTSEKPEEEGDVEFRPDLYRLCGTPQGLRAVYGALLEKSRPWRFRWLEGVLDAFGGDDVARFQGEGGEIDARKTRGPHRGGADKWGNTKAKDGARSGGLDNQAEMGEGNGKRLVGPTEETQGGDASQEERDWERECAKQVQAREGGLLQRARGAEGIPLGGGPGRARPRYRYELHREEGRIEIFCTDVPQTIIQWSAYTPAGNNRRDFRFLTRDYGNCSTIRLGGGCVQPFCFTPRTLKPGGPNLGDGVRYDARLASPEQGYGAFFVEMRWRGLWDRPLYVFSTPALVVPDTYPFPDCRLVEGGCTGQLL